MKLSAFALLALIPLGGCNHMRNAVSSTETSIKPVPEPTPQQKVALLRYEAKKRGLHWYVFCVPGHEGDPNSYQADAFQPGDDGTSRFVEDGAKDSWAQDSSTPEDAAYLLYKSITSEGPTQRARNKPRVSDCDYNTVLDDKHTSNIPCSQNPATK